MRDIVWNIGVDVGGTFTDVVLISDDGLSWDVQKVPSTPEDLSRGCVEGILSLLERNAVGPEEIRRVVHGTTAPINALLTRRGAHTALVTTKGFRDVLEIARQMLPNRYNLRVRKPAPLVTRDLCLEVQERTAASGQILVSVEQSEVDSIAQTIRDKGIQAVAIGLLNSYANDLNEVVIEERLKTLLPDVYVSRSSAVANQFREYERFSTTTVNSYIGPIAARYFGAFQERLEAAGISAPLTVFQSNGGLSTLAGAQARPASLLMSGPAAGVIASAELGRAINRPNLITLDIGGTSCDVAVVVDGAPLQISSRTIEGLPILSPMIDVHSIGAGGGSIAWIDQGGLLRVGPQSAGAVPGPAGYGHGGITPTVSDANLVLGRLNPHATFGGKVTLHRDLSETAIQENLVDVLHMNTEQIACGIIEVVNANMARAVRVMTVERGHDPREFTLVAFGGAGTLHACDLADELGIAEILIPAAPGALCALGALLADFRFDVTQTRMLIVDPANPGSVLDVFSELVVFASDSLQRFGRPQGEMQYTRTVAMRYRGQNYELLIDLDYNSPDPVGEMLDRFHTEHRRLYGYSQPHSAVQAVNFRLTVTIPTPKSLPEVASGEGNDPGASTETRPIYFPSLEGWHDTPVINRSSVDAGAKLAGPLVIEQADTTILITPGWTVCGDTLGNLIASKSADFAA